MSHSSSLDWQLLDLTSEDIELGSGTAAAPASSMFSAILSLEAASYPEDEACTESSLRVRFSQAADFVKPAVWKETEEEKATAPATRLMGFVMGTLSTSSVLTHDSMSTHEAKGEYLCIHSVVVAEKYRKKGLGKAVLVAYIERMKQRNVDLQTSSSSQSQQHSVVHKPLKTILLLCKQPLVHFYESCGFILNGVSEVQHGKDQWMEMSLKL